MKRILQFMLLLGMLILPVLGIQQPAIQTVHAADPLMVEINYFRFDSTYANWNAWVWAEGDSSGLLPLTEAVTYNDQPWVKYTFNANATVSDIYVDWARTTLGSFNPQNRPGTTLGVIIRTNAGTKDAYDADRFIDLTQISSDGKVHVYIVQGNATLYYDLEDVDASPLGAAAFTDKTHFTVNGFVALPTVKSSYKAYCDNQEITVSNVVMSNSNKTATVTLSSAVAVNSSCEVAVTDLGRKPIDPSAFFSSAEFSSLFTYSGELGAIYSKASTTFRVWAPTANRIDVSLYDAGDGGAATQTVQMTAGEKGTFSTTINGDLHGKYYTYTVHLKSGVINTDVVDPYAYSTGVNGNRGMILDFSKTNPTDWDEVTLPDINNANDAIVYELHVRDLTSHASWNGTAANRGKFLGLIEEGTTYQGVKTGFDHIKDLGVTHVQLLPIFDYRSVDETRLADINYQTADQGGIFNWGYDPKNYNSLEGSYSSNPRDGIKRVQEFKQVVKAYADNGMGIIMDVVYNHMPSKTESSFNKIVPNYYFRTINNSGAGSDTASERPMFRKFMVDSTTFWAREYKLAGFRFDLMGLHDYTTMNELAESVRNVNPDAIIYGEGWDMFTVQPGSNLTKSMMAIQANVDEMDNIGAFNDATRTGLRGPVMGTNNETIGAILIGDAGTTNYWNASVAFGLVGAVSHPDVSSVNVRGTGAPYPWGTNPSQSINYAEAHDNATLYDKNRSSRPGQTNEYYESLQKQAYSMILTGQGVPFLHAGVEMMRTKEYPDGFPLIGDYTQSGDLVYSHNSYNMGDAINAIDWQWAVDHQGVVEHYKTAIALRKAHPVFSLDTAEQVQTLMNFFGNDSTYKQSYMLAYELDGTTVNDPWAKTVVIHNYGNNAFTANLTSSGEWTYAAGFGADTDGVTFTGSTVLVSAHSTVILYQTNPDYIPPKEPGLFGCAGSVDTVGGSTGLGTVVAAGALAYLLKKSALRR